MVKLRTILAHLDQYEMVENIQKVTDVGAMLYGERYLLMMHKEKFVDGDENQRDLYQRIFDKGLKLINVKICGSREDADYYFNLLFAKQPFKITHCPRVCGK